MNILISNDDGINSPSIKALANRISKKHNVLMVAPSDNRSATAHSLSIGKPIKVIKHNNFDFDAYSITGSPADCAKIARLMFPNFNADVVLAGVNTEHNIGSDTLYSGTVAICYESAYYNRVAFAFSAYHYQEKFVEKYALLAEEVFEKIYPLSQKGDIWNVNFPDLENGEPKGIKLTALGKHIYSDHYEKIGENEYKLVGDLIDHNENVDDCDVNLIKKGYITVTPMLFNRTNYKRIEEINKGL